MNRRAALRWLLAAIAVAATAVAATRPWYQHVSEVATPPGYPGGGGYRVIFGVDEPGMTTHEWTQLILKVLLTLAVAVVIATRSARRGHRRAIAGATAAIAIAGGTSIYVLFADTALWHGGLTWAWGSATALGLLAALTIGSSTLGGAAEVSAR